MTGVNCQANEFDEWETLNFCVGSLPPTLGQLQKNLTYLKTLNNYGL